MSGPSAPWWRPDRFAPRRPYLEARARVAKAIRAHFDAQGFVEVDTPALQVSPGLEPHLEVFATELVAPLAGGRAPRYLHTSPEFAMKKLLAAGMERIFQLAHVFRNAEGGRLHHPEFTILEWYRAGADYRDLVEDCRALLVAAVEAAGTGRLVHGEAEADPAAPWRVMTVAEAFDLFAGVDLETLLPDPGGAPDPVPFKAVAAELGIACADDDRWDDVFFRIFLDRIEPELGLGAPTVLTGYPASMAALARLDPDDPRIAQRFELYACGVELANAFGELTDAAEQRARFAADRAFASARYGRAAPVDEDFLAALDHGLPPSAGIALGFDRLVMLATGAPDVDSVLWAPVAAP
ncbi:MAG: EF-P lysine aminoacylase EpmA [Azospirillaceae bacterium]